MILPKPKNIKIERYIGGLSQFKKIENAKLNFDIAKKFFLEAKKNFGYNEELYLGISLIYKYLYKESAIILIILLICIFHKGR